MNYYVLTSDYLAERKHNHIINGCWSDNEKLFRKGEIIEARISVDVFSGRHFLVTDDDYKINPSYVKDYNVVKKEKSNWKMPTIELVKYDKKKGTTVVKFKGIRKAVKSKVNPKEKFSEFEGLVTCLLKQASGMSNQELKRYLEHADKKTI